MKITKMLKLDEMIAALKNGKIIFTNSTLFKFYVCLNKNHGLCMSSNKKEWSLYDMKIGDLFFDWEILNDD